MFKSPRTFRHVYAAITAILVGLAIWLASQVRLPVASTAPQPRSVYYQTTFQVTRQWYLEKVPNKDAIDGYELHVHDLQKGVDENKITTP